MSKLNDRTKGILLVVLEAFFFAAMGAFVRLAGDVPSIQKSFFRNIVSAFVAAAVLISSKEKFQTKRENLKFLILRATCGTVGILGNFYAIDHMALSDASMLNKLSPFFATVFSIFILKERANAFQLSAVILAFLGSLLVIKPGFAAGSFLPGFVGFLGGMGAGAAYTFVRLLNKRGERKPFIVFFFSAFSSLVALPWMIFDYHPMSHYQLLMLICAGLCACGGQFAITSAYSYAPAKEISVFDYTQIVFSTLMGFALFGQGPDVLSFIGYAVIIGVAVCVFVVQHKKDGSIK